MQGVEIKVVDRQGQVVPIGQQGEIWARGYPIMRGYYGDAEKTAESLTPSGWLRTGDVAEMDEDGYLYFIGRQKEIIIRGGVNIYPIEIENAIIEHPSVAQAQVFSVPDKRYGEEVCAWIILKPNVPKCRAEDIQNFLKDKLAFFKIPKHIRFVDKFITTPTVDFLLNTLIDYPQLLLTYIWHLILCIDPDGTRLNDGWFSGPFTIRNYARNFYRPSMGEQVEWTFPITYKNYIMCRDLS
ncbi:unnamed protein product [Rotaria sordida]|uniref:Medium-chain acyl-CoA ligase ACSF2, mitochondrial n=1 Tax=Rotaria sordida TaxID=392033 RepID=A0A819MMV5_9BILA|nr:unnamed protein product [Rotaria sordida]CAF3982344.1 unnamed protein product [Rotaria sordida]